MQSLDLEIARRVATAHIACGMARLKWLAAATRFEIALRRHDRALKLAYKYGYDPAQPRVPAGDPDGGRWTGANGNTISSRRTRLAGEIPTGDSPKIPKKRPPTSRERTAAFKAAARWLNRFGGPIGKLVEGAEWLRNHSPLIEAYRDPPKSLDELQQGAQRTGLGYDVHHIVEQTQAEDDGFPREMIDSPENKVRIPRMKHWDINGWYQRPNPDYDWETPHDYLSGRSWAVRRSVGLRALRIYGVLKP